MFLSFPGGSTKTEKWKSGRKRQAKSDSESRWIKSKCDFDESRNGSVAHKIKKVGKQYVVTSKELNILNQSIKYTIIKIILKFSLK